MRRAGNIDRNHTAIVQALHDIGAGVQSLANVGNGCPDLLVGYHDRTMVLEVKNEGDSPSHRALSAAQVNWHATWPGQVAVVYTPEEAKKVVIAHCCEVR